MQMLLRGSLSFGILILMLSLGARPAQALSLADLAAGASFTSEDGLLLFDDFVITPTGSVTVAHLALLQINLNNAGGFDISGFDIVGPISAADGEIGDLNIVFSVTSEVPITGATLAFNGGAFGIGSVASVTEVFTGFPSVALLVAITGGGTVITEDSARLGEGIFSLRVNKDILVDSTLLGGGTGGLASISSVSQQFALAIPEPSALILLGLGFGALVLRRR